MILAICDADQAYGEKLGEWIFVERGERFLGCCFSQPEAFLAYYEGQKPDIVLLGEGFLEDPRIWELVDGKTESSRQENGHTLWLCLYGKEGMGMEQNPACIMCAGLELPVLGKYQPASRLVREILKLCQGSGWQEEGVLFQNELIAVYSPGRSALQTPFALTLAQALGKQGQALYVSFQECAGFAQRFQEEYERDLLDVMYLCLAQDVDAGGCIGSAAYRLEDFDYIPPARDGDCLCGISEQDYQRFLSVLARESGYQVIVLDFGMMVPGFFHLLAECGKTYILEDGGECQGAPLGQFWQMLQRQGIPGLEDKMEYLTLPECSLGKSQGRRYLQQYIWGELGDYVRTLMGVQGGAD